IASQPFSTPRSTALAGPPAGETCAPMSMGCLLSHGRDATPRGPAGDAGRCTRFPRGYEPTRPVHPPEEDLMRRSLLAAALVALLAAVIAAPAPAAAPGLWQVYDQAFKGARYIDLTHTITPSIPVWSGFGPSTFAPAVDPTNGQPYSWSQGLG